MARGLVDLARRCPGVFGGALALAAFFLGGSAVAQTQENAAATKQEKPEKPAWQWTLDERLAARFDPEGMKRRAAEDAALRRKSEIQFGERFDAPDDQLALDGRKEPALFLPGELFNALLSSAFHENAFHEQEVRSWIEERAAILGFGSDIWVRLEKVTAPYLRLRDESHLRALEAHARSEDYETSEKETLEICRAQAQALAAAKAEFGEQAFLRLLYEVRASTLSITYIGTEGTSDHLRFREGGCQ